jgi:RNA polymerase sigma-70 factor, ECF subfamily
MTWNNIDTNGGAIMLSTNNSADVCLLDPTPSCLYELERLVSDDLERYTRQAKRYLDWHQDAEDAVQDALLLAYEHLGTFRNQAKLSTWLTTIVINAARSRRRRRKPHNSYEYLLDSVESPMLIANISRDKRPDSEEVYAREEMCMLLTRLVDGLSPIYRTAVYQFNVNGLNTDASSALGFPISTFKAHLLRARQKLRHRIEDSAGLQLRNAPIEVQ